jgi:glutaredoxin
MMEKRAHEIELEISRLKEELSNVEGSTTEVYSRIVGYYRSVKNWNLGKKEEYKSRIPFTKMDKDAEILVEEISPLTDKVIVNTKEINSYNFYYRNSCPNCPDMKDVLKQLSIEGEDINVDMERGLDAASENLVFSAPTVIFRSANGDEVFRTGHPSDVRGLFKLESVSA